jgi:hypothetical protein
MTTRKKYIIAISALAVGWAVWYFFIDKENYAQARMEYINRLPNDETKLIQKILKSTGQDYNQENVLKVKNAYPDIAAQKNRLADLNIPKYLRNYL